MNSSNFSARRLPQSKQRRPFWIGLLLILLTSTCLTNLTGCKIKLGEEKIVIARAVQTPEETKGFVQVIDAKEVRGVVLGGSEPAPVGDLSVGDKKEYPVWLNGKIEKINASGMLLLWMEDVAALVRNTKRMNAILKDPEISKLIKEKGL